MIARRGMTLVELVVALTVTGIVAALGAATFDAVIGGRTRAREASFAATSAAATRSLIVSWLTSGQITAEATTTNVSTGLNLNQNDDALLVIATTSTPINAGRTVVLLSIDRDEETPEKGLVARLESLDVESADLQTTVTRTVQLDSTITGLLLEYLDGESRRWIPRREAVTRSPLAVRVTFSATAPDTLPMLLRLPIVQPMPRPARGNQTNQSNPRANPPPPGGRGGR